MMTISPKAKSVVTKSLFAALIAGTAMVVGCGSTEGDSQEPLAQLAAEKGLLDGAQSTNALRARPSEVTCSGDQNNGGRICCDATHCCINILGVINCSLPPRKAAMK